MASAEINPLYFRVLGRNFSFLFFKVVSVAFANPIDSPSYSKNPIPELIFTVEIIYRVFALWAIGISAIASKFGSIAEGLRAHRQIWSKLSVRHVFRG